MMHRGEAKPAVPVSDGGHPVPTADRAIRIPMDWRIVVRVEVNGPWSHDQPRGIEDFRPIAAAYVLRDFDNLAVLDSKVSLVRWHQRAINNCTAFNDCIEL